MREIKSESWKINFQEFDKPIWLIIGAIPLEEYGEFEILIGMCPARSKEEALTSVDDADYAFLEAYEIMSIISQAHMMSDIANIIDSIDLE